MQHSGADGGFPDLRIVAVEDLLLHEDVDLERVARLIDRLSADGILRNPPIVASLPASDRFLLLDGANRVSAIQNLDISHLLVQVEPFENPALAFRHWNHVVRDLEANSLFERLDRIPDAEVTREAGLPGERLAEGVLAVVIASDGSVREVRGPSDLSARVRILRAMTEIYYRREARLDRVGHIDLEAIRGHHPHFGALVRFTDFAKADVRALAEAGDHLPSGVTRILVPRRVLGFNLQLALLKSALPLADKSRWLADEIHQKVSDKKVRYYQEPTFIFDD